MKKAVWAGVGAVGAIAFVLFGKTMLSQRNATEDVDAAIAALAPYAEVEYDKVSTPFFGGSTTVKDLVITPNGSAEPIRVNEFILYDLKENEAEVPTYLKMEINGVEVDRADLDPDGAFLGELGYEEEILANFSAEYSYEEDDRSIEIKRLSMGADDIGEFEMTLNLANVTMDEQTVANMPFSLFGMEFERAAINYQDASFFDRMFETAAEEEGISVDEAKEQAIAELELAAENGELPLQEETIQELSNFIENPDSFSITFNPEQPVPFSSLVLLSDSAEIFQLLNVEFES